MSEEWVKELREREPNPIIPHLPKPPKPPRRYVLKHTLEERLACGQLGLVPGKLRQPLAHHRNYKEWVRVIHPERFRIIFCAWCSDPIKVGAANDHRMCCSKECISKLKTYNQWMIVALSHPPAWCKICGKRINRFARPFRFTYCSDACYNVAHGRKTGYRKHIPALLERDGNNCQLCGGLLVPNAPHHTPLHTTVDHIIARNNGESDDIENLQLAHMDCNSRKHDGDI